MYLGKNVKQGLHCILLKRLLADKSCPRQIAFLSEKQWDQIAMEDLWFEYILPKSYLSILKYDQVKSILNME